MDLQTPSVIVVWRNNRWYNKNCNASNPKRELKTKVSEQTLRLICDNWKWNNYNEWRENEVMSVNHPFTTPLSTPPINDNIQHCKLNLTIKTWVVKRETRVEHVANNFFVCLFFVNFCNFIVCLAFWTRFRARQLLVPVLPRLRLPPPRELWIFKMASLSYFLVVSYGSALDVVSKCSSGSISSCLMSPLPADHTWQRNQL